MNTGIDGGMNKVFAAALPNGDTGLSEGGQGQGLSLVRERLPGTIPIDHVNPPHAPSDSLLAGAPEEPKIAAPAPAAPATRVATAAPAEQSGGFFSNLARKVGLGSATADTTATAAPPPPTPAKPKAEAKAKPTKPAETKQAAAKPALKPSVTDNASTAAAAPPPAAQNSVVAGAQPIVPANSFDTRFSAVK
jgi:hypothetical protein